MISQLPVNSERLPIYSYFIKYLFRYIAIGEVIIIGSKPSLLVLAVIKSRQELAYILLWL